MKQKPLPKTDIGKSKQSCLKEKQQQFQNRSKSKTSNALFPTVTITKESLRELDISFDKG